MFGGLFHFRFGHVPDMRWFLTGFGVFNKNPPRT